MDITTWKNIFLATFATALAELTTVVSTIELIVTLFFFDTLFGIAAGWAIHNEGFRWKKAGVAAAAILVYILLVAIITVIGVWIENREGSHYAVAVVTYLFIYLTGLNMLKNLSRIFPAFKLFKALHYMLSLEFASRFSDLNKKLKDDEN